MVVVTQNICASSNKTKYFSSWLIINSNSFCKDDGNNTVAEWYLLVMIDKISYPDEYSKCFIGGDTGCHKGGFGTPQGLSKIKDILTYNSDVNQTALY